MTLQDELDHYTKLVIWKLSALEVNRGYMGLMCVLSFSMHKLQILHYNN